MKPRASRYRTLLDVPHFPRLCLGMLWGRAGGLMVPVAVLLYALSAFHSPMLAALMTCCFVAPGLAVYPLAGALLDRRGRTVVMMTSYAVLALDMGALALLDTVRALSPMVLLFLVIVASVAVPFGEIGLRTLFPFLVPRPQWDVANALDTATSVIAGIVGPTLAGVLMTTVGGPLTFAVVGMLVVTAGWLSFGLPEPEHTDAPRALLANARAGLNYVAHHPTLRPLAVSMSIWNIGAGVIVVSLPVLITRQLGQSGSMVGLAFAVIGCGGTVGGLVCGRIDSENRERLMVALTMVLSGIGLLALAFANSLSVVLMSAALIGLANGPLFTAVSSLRQRRSDHRLLGRVIAISVACNTLGNPVGSLLAGPLLQSSASLPFVIGSIASIAAGAWAWWCIPASSSDSAVEVMGAGRLVAA